MRMYVPVRPTPPLGQQQGAKVTQGTLVAGTVLPHWLLTCSALAVGCPACHELCSLSCGRGRTQEMNQEVDGWKLGGHGHLLNSSRGVAVLGVLREGQLRN